MKKKKNYEFKRQHNEKKKKVNQIHVLNYIFLYKKKINVLNKYFITFSIIVAYTFGSTFNS
jgi:hypothetical protein